MSKLAERIYNRYFAKQPMKRRYAAAKRTRTNKDWTTETEGANRMLYRDLRILRARAREMAKNAPHFKKFLRMAKRNVVGNVGIQLQCTATIGTAKTLRPNTKLNSMIETAFWEWSFKENCSASGKLCFKAAQDLLLTHLIRDGEALVQHITADNPFGYALKFWNVDWLDENYNEELAGGRRIIMSVEVDANYRPIAYWLTTPASEMGFVNRQQRQRLRIPADQMSHIYIVDDDESQVRGTTWFAASMLAGKDLHEYTSGVVQSARVQSHIIGFIEEAEPDGTQYTGGEDEEGREKALEIDVAPLSINELNPGQKFNQLDPKQPTQNHPAFKKSMMLDVAAGLDVNGFSLAGDMGDVNYSSARVGLGEERDVWRDLQTVVTDFCRDVYHRWLKSAMMSSKLEISDKDYGQLQNPNWKARGWRYVDPQKEIKANIEAIGGNLATYRSVLAEQGIDLEEFLAEKQAEKALFEQYDIEYAPTPKQLGPGAADETDDETGDETGPKKPQDDGERGYLNGKYAN
jgi:lambda family phage portal protein